MIHNWIIKGRVFLSVGRKYSIIPVQGYSSVVKEITYIPIIRKGELIFNLLFPQASSRRNLDKKMKHNDEHNNDTDDYILRW
jgi:hypothetical protein